MVARGPGGWWAALGLLVATHGCRDFTGPSGFPAPSPSGGAPSSRGGAATGGVSMLGGADSALGGSSGEDTGMAGRLPRASGGAGSRGAVGGANTTGGVSGGTGGKASGGTTTSGGIGGLTTSGNGGANPRATGGIAGRVNSGGTGGGSAVEAEGGAPTGGAGEGAGAPSGAVGGASGLNQLTGGAPTGGAPTGGVPTAGAAGSAGFVWLEGGTAGGGPDPIPPRKHQSISELWNVWPAPYQANVYFCFLTRPRQTDDGQVFCPDRADDLTDCYGNRPSFPNIRELWRVTRHAVLDRWQRAAALELWGWTECPIDGETDLVLDRDLHNMVAIAFADVDRADLVGCDATSAHLLYLDWRKLAAKDYSGLIHEVGHVLGFADEWNEPGYQVPEGCSWNPNDHPTVGFLDIQGQEDDQFEDPFGIMGACYPQRLDGSLGPGDVATAQAAYSAKPAGSLAGDEALCLTNCGPRGAAKQWPCRPWSGALWQFDPVARTFSSVLPDDGERYCLGTLNDRVDQVGPTNVDIALCDGRRSQTVVLANTAWRALGTNCIEATDQGLVNRPCSVTPNQRWAFFDTDPDNDLVFDQIQLAGTEQCVTTPNLDGTAGDQLDLAFCDATDPRQQFETPGEGMLTQGGLCVHASTRVAGSDFPLELTADCGTYRAPFSARFHLTSEVRILGQCLTAPPNAFEVPGGPIDQVEQCRPDSEHSGQVWDYHF